MRVYFLSATVFELACIWMGTATMDAFTHFGQVQFVTVFAYSFPIRMAGPECPFLLSFLFMYIHCHRFLLFFLAVLPPVPRLAFDLAPG